VIIDLRSLVSFTDFFVCATANNARQVRAVVSAARGAARDQHQVLARGSEGAAQGRWVLCDFGDVVLHVFDRDMRGFYDIDGLWGDAPRLPLPEVVVPADDEDDEEDDVEFDDLGPVFRLT